MFRVPLIADVIKSKIKWRKLEIRKLFDANKTQVLLFNFIAEDYNQLLKRLVGLVGIFPSSLKFIIVYLPKGAQNVDLFYARRI